MYSKDITKYKLELMIEIDKEFIKNNVSKITIEELKNLWISKCMDDNQTDGDFNLLVNRLEKENIICFEGGYILLDAFNEPRFQGWGSKRTFNEKTKTFE